MESHSQQDDQTAGHGTGYVSDTAFLKLLDENIEANLRNDQFGVEDLAQAIHLSRSQVHRRLKTLTNKSVSQYIREFRLKRAMELLKSDAGSASDIAYLVGFSSPSYFNKCFVELYGIPPGEAKKSGKKDFTTEEPIALPKQRRLKINPVQAVITVFLIALIGLLILDKEELDTAAGDNQDLSIAILPFKDLNEDSESKYFSNGTMDAILANLVQYEQFRVISRTSVEQYRHTTKTIPEIARELGVTHVLEGSVQRSDQDIRIIVQLIRGNDDAHLWAKTYDRELTDVFAIQSEIAQLVAGELYGEIGDGPPVDNNRPTDSFEAYDLFLRGVQFHKNYFYRRNEDDLYRAKQLYDRALALDREFLSPQISQGWVLIDRVRWLSEDQELLDSAILLAQRLNTRYPDNPDVLTLLGTAYRYKGGERKRARNSLVRAVALSPNHAWATELLGWYFAFEESRRDIALVLHHRALQLDPLNAGLYEALGWHWAALQEYDKSREAYGKALELKPDNVGARQGLALVEILSDKDYPAALEHLDRALDYSPDNPSIYHHIARVSAWGGDFETSMALFEKIIALTPGSDYVRVKNAPWMPNRYAFTLWNSGREREARHYFQLEIERDLDLLADSIENAGFSPYYDLAGANAFLGQKDQAFEWLQQIIPTKSWGDPAYITEDPMFEPIKSDPRFLALVQSWKDRSNRQKDNYRLLRDKPISEIIEGLSISD